MIYPQIISRLHQSAATFTDATDAAIDLRYAIANDKFFLKHIYFISINLIIGTKCITENLILEQTHFATPVYQRLFD